MGWDLGNEIRDGRRGRGMERRRQEMEDGKERPVADSLNLQNVG